MGSQPIPVTRPASATKSRTRLIPFPLAVPFGLAPLAVPFGLALLAVPFGLAAPLGLTPLASRGAVLVRGRPPALAS